LLKPVRTSELLAAVRDVFLGGSPMSSHIARRVVRAFNSPSPSVSSASAAAPPVEGLSERESEILTHLAQGYLYKEISDQLGVSYSTVRTHIERIYRKLHVQSRAQAVAVFRGVPKP
jgi:DNA-binding NarL/FixJ family response regulator